MEGFCGLLSPLDLIAHPPAKHLHTHIARVLTEQNKHFKNTWIISMVMVMNKKYSILLENVKMIMMVMTHRRTINLRLLVPIFRVAKADEAGEGKSWKFLLIIFIEK